LPVKGDEVYGALRKAICREIGAFNFYNSIAEEIVNPKGRDKFLQIAKDEEIHREKLESWFKKLYGEEFEARKEELEESEIKGVRLNEQSGAVKALDTAIEAESMANRFYSQQAGKVDDDRLSKLYLDLAREEEGHYNLLLAEKNAVIGGFYWFDMDSTAFMED